VIETGNVSNALHELRMLWKRYHDATEPKRKSLGGGRGAVFPGSCLFHANSVM
jgi:hypothetical protein